MVACEDADGLELARIGVPTAVDADDMAVSVSVLLEVAVANVVAADLLRAGETVATDVS